MSNPAQMINSAKRRKRIVALCRVGTGMTVPEISKAIDADHRTVRDDVRKLEQLGYLQSVGSKLVRLVMAETFMTVAEQEYPLPDEPQDHPRKVEKPQPAPMPPGARIVKLL